MKLKGIVSKLAMPLIFLLFTVFLLVSGFRDLNKLNDYKANGVAVDAVIYKVKDGSGDDSYMYFKYTYDGKEYSHMEENYPDGSSVGTVARGYLYPSNPERLFIYTNNDFIFACFMLAFAMASLYIFNIGSKFPPVSVCFAIEGLFAFILDFWVDSAGLALIYFLSFICALSFLIFRKKKKNISTKERQYMDFEQFKNTYFNGDTDAALRGLVKDSDYFDNYALTGSREEFKGILDSLDENLANTYVDILFEELEIAGISPDAASDFRNKLLSANLVESLLEKKKSVIFGFGARKKLTKVLNDKGYYFTFDTVINKKFVEGDFETGNRHLLFFKENGKYDDMLLFNKTKESDNCYILKIPDSKKIIKVYNSNVWKISENDFYYSGGKYIHKNNKNY